MKRVFYIISGCIFLILGLIGLALPVIPQVPFLVFGGLLLARGSRYIHEKLVSHPWYKSKIRPLIRKSRLLSGLLEEPEDSKKEEPKSTEEQAPEYGKIQEPENTETGNPENKRTETDLPGGDTDSSGM